MKKKIVYGSILFCAIVLQTSVLPIISPAHSVGDVMLMLVLAGAVLDGFFGFFWWAIFAGIIYDLVSYTTVGLHALIFVLLLYFVSFFARRFSVEFRGVGLFLFMLFVVVATFFSRVIVAMMISWDLQSLKVFWTNVGNFSDIGVQVIYNMILFAFCFVVLKKAKKFFDID